MKLSYLSKFREKNLFAGLLLFMILVVACSRSQDQVEFEKNAFQIPTGFTETTPNGEIISVDEDDWRIGPMFQGLIEVEVPPFPNPTRGESLEMQLLINGRINGIRAVAYYDMFDERTWRLLDEHNQSPVEDMLVILTINPADFDRTRSYSAARNINNGLHRLFIYDNRNNLITYGDIKLK